MLPAIDVIRRGRNPAAVIYLRAAPVISWAGIPGRLNPHQHFASALVMQSIRE
ncbi:MAG TPA: hypothetical protein VGJ66_00875 [Pyrinomonadaceae bacterium]